MRWAYQRREARGGQRERGRQDERRSKCLYCKVPEARVELARGCPRRILSPPAPQNQATPKVSLRGPAVAVLPDAASCSATSLSAQAAHTSTMAIGVIRIDTSKVVVAGGRENSPGQLSQIGQGPIPAAGHQFCLRRPSTARSLELFQRPPLQERHQCSEFTTNTVRLKTR
jgi:hypothetical protein